uniref:SUEL-type lectin domain-containing protein n=1 Tax=Neogobius melanostomus TaxID=47308 RepID=A0A8C6SIL3_9GOBI
MGDRPVSSEPLAPCLESPAQAPPNTCRFPTSASVSLWPGSLCEKVPSLNLVFMYIFYVSDTKHCDIVQRCVILKLCLSAPGKVIRVHAADYGRRNSQTCAAGRPASQLQNVHCLSSTCNGRNICSISSSNPVYGDPCPGTDKYLHLSFYCICEFSVSPLSDPGKTIKILEVHYGRQDQTTCSEGRPPSQVEDVTCSSVEAPIIVTDLCDDFADCTFIANGSVIHDPCPSTYKYLQVTYFCKAP